MHVVLILIRSIATLIIGPTMTTSSKLLRTLATASTSVAICLISLKIGFAAGAVLSTVLLKCTSLKIDNSEIDVDYIEVFGLYFVE